MNSLHLFSRLAESTTSLAYLDSLSELARRYRHKAGRIGGYLDASFTLGEDQLTAAELAEFYNTYVGCHIVERTFGDVSWQGYIESMRLYRGGVEHLISVEPEYCRNRIKVLYIDDASSRMETDYSENTDSSGIFGEINWIESLSGTTTAGATAWRDTYLVTHAWPRSRIVGGDARESKTGEPLLDELHVTCKGYFHSMGRRYQETNIDDTASNAVTTLVGNSEFVTAGRIETNALTVRVEGFPVYVRLNDALEEVIEQGDASSNLWEGGVYTDREFTYEQADTDWHYQLQSNVLLDKGKAPIPLSLVRPGFLLYAANAPTGWAYPGTSIDWDDPKIGYVDEVTYIRGVDVDELRMHYFGTPPSAHVLAKQMRGY